MSGEAAFYARAFAGEQETTVVRVQVEENGVLVYRPTPLVLFVNSHDLGQVLFLFQPDKGPMEVFSQQEPGGPLMLAGKV